jgi:hypothetical protein
MTMSAIPQELPPPLVLFQLLTGKWALQTLAAAAELGVFDRIGDTPRTAVEIAADSGYHEGNLYRLMRALASLGLLSEADDRRFALTAAGTLLRKDVPAPFATGARMLGSEWHNLASSGLAEAVRSGAKPFRLKHGKPLFEWLKEHPQELEVFHNAMSFNTASATEAVLGAYDFSRFKRIADVGGGQGEFLARVLQAAPAATGILFDLPEAVAAGGQAVLEKAGVQPRCEIVGGDFFTAVPGGCDAYLLKYVVHDWGDDEGATILSRCAEGLAPGGRVLLFETVLPPSGAKSLQTLVDIEMLIVTDTGRERTEQEFGALLARAGLKIQQIIPTPSPLSIVEAVRA